MASILELLNSTYKLDVTRRPSYVFGKKKFGQIFTMNKTIVYKPESSVIEISMVMGVATELNKSAHRMYISLHGIKGEEFTAEELCQRIKEEHPELEEEKDYDILFKTYRDIPLLKGKSIIQKSSDKNKFYVFPNKIPLTTQIRVKCTCSDFYYTYAWYNAEHKALIGRKPPRYKKYIGLDWDEEKSFKPVRNPRRLPGVCKHLLLFIALLMKGDILRTSSIVMNSFKSNSEKLNFVARVDLSNELKNLRKEVATFNKENKRVAVETEFNTGEIGKREKNRKMEAIEHPNSKKKHRGK